MWCFRKYTGLPGFDLTTSARCFIVFSMAPQREADGEPISHAGSQSVRQAGMQLGKQVGRQAGKHTIWLFSVSVYDDKHWGTSLALEPLVVEWFNIRTMYFLVAVRNPAGGLVIAGPAARPLSLFLYSALVKILLTTKF